MVNEVIGSMQKRLFVVYKTIFTPTAAAFIGMHATNDPTYATPHNLQDPYLGNGPKLIALLREHPLNLFRQQQLYLGNEESATTFYKARLRELDYDDPLCLNSKQGAPANVAKSNDHRVAIGEALVVPMMGNNNAEGSAHNIPVPEGMTRKYINNGTEEVLAIVRRGVNPPMPDGYEGWKLGRLKLEKTGIES